MSSLDGRLSSLLDKRKLQKRFRSLKEYDLVKQPDLIDFSSNDYLSLTASQSLRSKYLSRLESSPTILGSTGSRLLSGSTPQHTALENRFKKVFNSPDALLFNSGWDANVSFFSTVPQAGDIVIYDELVHASVHSGMRSSRVPQHQRIAFAHNDVESLRQVLQQITQQPMAAGSSTSASREPIIFVALESLYSMDGDIAPLPRILDILDAYVPRSGQCVVLDEAHSTAVYGKAGRGITCALGEEGGWDAAKSSRPQSGRVTVRLMTFGKAVGCSGAVLLCSSTIRSFLINFARPLIFSTALPHSTLVALEAAFDVIQSDEGEARRQSLLHLSKHLHTSLVNLVSSSPDRVYRLPESHAKPFPPGNPDLPCDPPSAIFGLITPKPHALSNFLLDKGFIVRPVVPPTVPPGSERVRICLRADMNHATVDRLVSALRSWASMEAKSPMGISGPHESLTTKARL